MDTLGAQDATDWTEMSAQLLDRVRTTAPQVHVLTSTVAQSLSANLLLAAGARPSMSGAPGEIEAFAARTGALVVNLGMLDAMRRDAIDRALPILETRRVGWVLDPVKVERSPDRLAYAQALIARGPSVVRANAGEMEAVGRVYGPVMATTGPVDVIEHEGRRLVMGNGDPLMARVTAMGCAGTTLVGAFLAVEVDAFVAAGAALLVLGVAGEIAGERAGGPGTFPPAFLDALYHLDATALASRARVQ